ncbi:hypothetical protein [Streptomyces sp. N2A]|uniref:tetratricopeptide repeat protein n=1 Tax=Streptomyces sp. N2A TaxID=3073936 RepID=UPI00286FD519|nr:hypothetical protein [Streptomyces sp. N2A]
MFNNSESERSLNAPLPAPRYMGWWVWSAMGFAGLIAALWGVGHKGGEAVTIGNFAEHVFGGLGAVLDPSSDASSGERLAILLITLVVLYFLWRATRAWLAYKPGAVDVQQLEDATPEGTPKPSNLDLTARLRHRLSDSSMYPPATLPAQAPAESFLELLGDVEIDPDKLGTAVPKLLSRLRPKLAYRVSGVLQYGDGTPDPYGMTVTVTAFLFGGSRAKDVWGSDWDDVIRKASSWTVSTLLPVTRAGRQPPWRRWWGQEIKAELYEAYQEANALSRAGRHHEALEQYFTAVHLDPVNPYLRAELAETQEKMGLHIDALDTCQRALTLDGQSVLGYHKRLWLSRWCPFRRLRYFLHPRVYRELIGLRYRNSIILGASETTAKKWVADWAAERAANRDSPGSKTCENLIPLFVDRYWPAALGLDGRKVPLLPEKRRQREVAGRNSLEETLRSGNAAEIGLVLQRASTQETARLAADDAWARLWLYWPTWVWKRIRFIWPAAYYQSDLSTPSPVTRGAFHINRRVGSPLRLTWATSAYGHNVHAYEWRWPYTWRRPVSRLSWHGLKIRSLRRRLRLAAPFMMHRDWHTHYNAACLYAVAMNAPHWDATEQWELGMRAVAHLDRAVQATRGKAAAVERTWLTEGDPDLKALRDKDNPVSTLFNNFVRTMYPSVETFERSPDSGRSEEQLREYDYRLLEEIAKVMQELWSQRYEQGDADIQCATEWLRTERNIWKSVREIADPNSRRRWQDRVSFIRYLQENCQPVATSALGFPPSLAPEDTAAQNGHSDSRIEKRLTVLQRDLERRWMLARTRGTSRRPYVNCHKGQRVLRDAAADGVTRLDARTIQRLSTGYAAAWQTLDDWLEGEARHRAFRQAVSDVPHLTRRRVTALREARTLRI